MKRAAPFAVFVLVALMFGAQNALSQPPWGNACGDGRVDMILDDLESTSGTNIFNAGASIPNPILGSVAGCHGNALSVDYDLTNIASNGQSWIVVQRFFASAQDLTPFTHLRLAVRGSNINSHDNVEIKLWDASGHLHAVSLRSLADLPVWRPLYIDLRELSGAGGLDLKHIAGFEIGVVRCSGCEVFDNPGLPPPMGDQHSGTLYVDELAVLDLKPGAAHRVVPTVFETVTPNVGIRASAADALLARVASSGPGAGLLPAWFPEPNPNFNSYAQAEALLVFIYEYERTGNLAYRNAARNLAARLLALQIPAGKIQGGAWYSAYTTEGSTLRGPDRALPLGSFTRCDGNETIVGSPGSAANIDTCEWAGNVGWVIISLARLQRSGLYDNAVALQNALDRGTEWLIGQPQQRAMADYPGLVTLGIEGNISAYFGLLAAQKTAEAARLGQAIFNFGWDPVQRRLKPGVSDVATALDVSGSWGATFLRSIGKTQEALDSQGYAASVLRTMSFDGAISGYGDIAGPYTVAVEFAAQAAAAGIYGAEFVMRQIYPLQLPSGPYAGAFRGGTDHWSGGQLTPWVTTMPGVSPTAWVYFASNIDPLWEIVSRNVALTIVGAVATASSTYDPTYAVSHLNDNNRAAGFWVDGTYAAFPDSVQITFNDSQTIDRVVVYSVQDDFANPVEPTDTMTCSFYCISAFTLEAWNGSAWVTLASVTGNNLVKRTVPFTAFTTDRIRINVTASAQQYSAIAEIEAWRPTAVPPPSSNVALANAGAVATASSTYDAAYAPSHVNDNNRAVGFWVDGTYAAFPDSVQITFNGSQTIDRVIVYSVQDDFANPVEPTDTTTCSLYCITTFTVDGWNGSAWVTLGSVTGSNVVKRTVAFTAFTTDRIRINVTGSAQPYSAIAEIEAWSP